MNNKNCWCITCGERVLEQRRARTGTRRDGGKRIGCLFLLKSREEDRLVFANSSIFSILLILRVDLFLLKRNTIVKQVALVENDRTPSLPSTSVNALAWRFYAPHAHTNMSYCRKSYSGFNRYSKNSKSGFWNTKAQTLYVQREGERTEADTGLVVEARWKEVSRVCLDFVQTRFISVRVCVWACMGLCTKRISSMARFCPMQLRRPREKGMYNSKSRAASGSDGNQRSGGQIAWDNLFLKVASIFTWIRNQWQ